MGLRGTLLLSGRGRFADYSGVAPRRLEPCPASCGQRCAKWRAQLFGGERGFCLRRLWAIGPAPSQFFRGCT